jgi:GTPase SAR1 family protein
VEILDTGGSEGYNFIRHQWIKNCGGLIFVYDISTASSLDLIEQQLCDAQTVLSNLHQQPPTAPTIPIALVGNKFHKLPSGKVSDEEGRQLADKYGAKFFETSAHDTKGFHDACVYLLREMGAGRAPSSASEESTAALKQPRTDWTKLNLHFIQRSIPSGRLAESEKDSEMVESHELDHREVSWWYWVCGIWAK